MNDMYHNLTSFLAIWFRNLQKSTYNVNVVNKEVDKISPLLYEKLQAIQFLLQDLQGKELKVKVSNQKELNTKDLEDKLTALLSGVKGIKLDNGTVERLLSDLISLSKGIKKVEVLNQPTMPSHMSVAGKVEVSNLPKVQEVKGDFNLKESKDILNALKELATEIRDLKLESIQGYKNMGSTFIGHTGSREAHKLTDGTKTATITTSGDSNALDVNIVAGGAGNGSILDGADTSIKATVKDLTNSNPLTVAIVDTSGDQIASFGGGTQYTEGDTDTTIVGTAIMWEDAGNALTPVSSSKPLPVSASIDPTGLATSAKQDTIIGHVDGIETLLGTIDADTSNLSTKIDTIAGDTTAIQAALETVGGLVVNLGANNDVTVTGTVDLGATDNAVLDTIAAKDFATQTTLAAINAKLVTGTDIGDVTINNSTGAAAVNIQDGGNSITVDGTVAVTGVSTAANQTTIIGHVDGIEALLTTIDADTSNLSVVGGGTEATALRVTIANNSTGVLSIDDNGSTVSIDDGGGVITVDGTVAVTNSDITSVKTATELLDDTVFVDDADWTADTSKHMLVGGVTQTAPTANTDGDTTPLITNNLRELRVAAKESDLATAGTTHVKKYYTNAGAVTDGIIWSPAAGKRWYCTLLAINVSAAATVTIEDDLAAGDSPVYKAELAANSGVVIPFGADAPMFSGEDAADLLVTTTAGNVYITCVGYEV